MDKYKSDTINGDFNYYKHAYLIIAHNEPEVLRELLMILDDKRNDIYLHIDKKSDYLYNEFKVYKLENASLIILREREDVRWGDISQIRVEIKLLKEALKNKTIYLYVTILFSALTRMFPTPTFAP